MQILGFDHISILVEDADRACAFYQDVLGLKLLPRPDLGFAGYWLDLGSGQALHLLALPNPYAQVNKPEHGGRDAHFALRVACVEQAAETLAQRGIDFTRSKSGRNAIFLHDPDQNALELFQT